MAAPIPARITQAQLADYKAQGYEDLAIGTVLGGHPRRVSGIIL